MNAKAKKRRQGRPAVPVNLRRSEHIPVVVTQSERKEIEAACDVTGQTTSTFGREAILAAARATNQTPATPIESENQVKS